MNAEYDVSYFKDDHNRILRFAIHKKTGISTAHILDSDPRVWVPLPRTEEPLAPPNVEVLSLEDLRVIAQGCPHYISEGTKSKGDFKHFPIPPSFWDDD